MPQVLDTATLDRLLSRVQRPARYAGGEWNAVLKDWDATPLRVALAFPDVYEIGMSNNAIPIFYRDINALDDALAERVYTPWPDMGDLLRTSGVPLFSLESRRPIAAFDILAFSLAYEQTYTNILELLDLAGIPLLARERGEGDPLVIAGGHCSLNPEPIADFFDLFAIGEGEEMLPALIDLLRQRKSGGLDRATYLRRAARVSGVYVPAFYAVDYHGDGTLASIAAVAPEAQYPVSRQYVKQIPPVVLDPVVPNLEPIFDRAVIEIQRGCTRGCRFCQAGMITRPTRIRSHDEIVEAVDRLVASCGYEEVSLLSLSSADYPGIDQVVARLAARYQDTPLTISLPSLRIDAFSVELTDALISSRGRRGSFTFAPEAGSERLREVINKAVPEEQIVASARLAFRKGWDGIKLYFMIGLPTETDEDVLQIAALARKLVEAGREELGGRPPRIKVSVGMHVPKPHTPFQWMKQDTGAEFQRKAHLLKDALRRVTVDLSYSAPDDAVVEAALARGDRRLGRIILEAWRRGARFDSWSEHFRLATWRDAFASCGLDLEAYGTRERDTDEILPWDHIDAGPIKSYLKHEWKRTLAGADPTATLRETGDCRDEACNACGLQKSEDQTCQRKFADLILGRKEAVALAAAAGGR